MKIRPFHAIIASISLLDLEVVAANLRIHTPVGLEKPLTIVTLKSDWTLDKTSKAEYLKSPEYEQRIINFGGGTLFEVSGVMEWDSEWSDGKRAFWVTDGTDPLQHDGVIRGWQKCTVKSLKSLKEDVYVFLSPKGNTADPSWTWKGDDDTLERNWLHCLGQNEEWDDSYFTKPDDTWS